MDSSENDTCFTPAPPYSPALSLYILYCSIAPVFLFFHALVIATILKWRQFFKSSFYTIILGQGIFDFCVLLGMTVRMFALTYNFSVLTIDCIIWFILASSYPGYVCQLTQAANRFAAIVAFRSYEKIFEHRRVCVILCLGAIFGLSIPLTFGIWHHLTDPLIVVMDVLCTPAAQTWAIFDEAAIYTVCIILTLTYAAAMISLRWIKRRTSHGTSANNGPSALEIKLTFHGIIITLTMIISEVYFLAQLDNQFLWEFFYVLSFGADPIVLLMLDNRLRTYCKKMLLCNKGDAVAFQPFQVQVSRALRAWN